MHLRLALKNLTAKPSRTLLTVVAITICMIFLSLFSAFQEGLRNYLFKNSLQSNPLTQISIQPKGQKLGLNPIDLLPQPKLTPEIIAAIKQIPHVTSIEPQNAVKGISSLQISMFGQELQTDALVFGSPYQTVASDEVSQKVWTSGNIGTSGTSGRNMSGTSADGSPAKPIPAIVSTHLIDLYNYSFATANNLPQLTPENFIGTDINILLDQSTFFGQQSSGLPTLKARIVGFSPKAKLIGITIPDSAVQQINQKYLKVKEINYVDAYVNVDSVENLQSVKKALDKFNLDISSGEDALTSINGYFLVMAIALNLIEIIMLGLAGLLIASTFLAKVTEKTKEIGILRALGITEKGVRKIFLYEAGMIGAFSGLFGFLIAFLLSTIADQILLNSISFLSNKPGSFFSFSPLLLLFTIVFASLFAQLFAYIPAKQASRLDPIKALSN
jgi:ABC-type antimicrobial peptide transport system permease subunit